MAEAQIPTPEINSDAEIKILQEKIAEKKQEAGIPADEHAISSVEEKELLREAIK